MEFGTDELLLNRAFSGVAWSTALEYKEKAGDVFLKMVLMTLIQFFIR